MTATTTTPVSSDPLLAAAHIMKAAGVISMGGAGVLWSFMSVMGIIGARLGGVIFILMGVVLAGVPFFFGYLVQASASAMLGRYTFNACRRAAVMALFLGPIGLLGGIYSLIKLHEPGVRESFNS